VSNKIWLYKIRPWYELNDNAPVAKVLMGGRFRRYSVRQWQVTTSTCWWLTIKRRRRRWQLYSLTRRVGEARDQTSKQRTQRNTRHTILWFFKSRNSHGRTRWYKNAVHDVGYTTASSKVTHVIRSLVSYGTERKHRT